MPEMSSRARWLVERVNGPLYRILLGRWLARLPLPANASILEVGGGSGDLALLVRKLHRPSRMVVTDYDAEQVATARRHFERSLGAIPSDVTIERADALSLPYREQEFDAAFAFLMLHHLGGHFGRQARASVTRGLAELDRVLKPGGKIVYLELVQLGTIRRFLTARGYTREARRRPLLLPELAAWRKPLEPAP